MHKERKKKVALGVRDQSNANVSFVRVPQLCGTISAPV
jgi:hypothetical protein